MILDFLSNVLHAVGGWFSWKASGVAQRDAAEERVKSRETAERARRAEVNRAVHEGDEASVNRLIDGAIALLVILGVMVAALIVAGCAAPPQTRYVAADRVVTCETNETGAVLYWRVPPLVMEELLNSRLELEEIKHENKVKEIAK